MSLFIAGLALEGTLLDAAKVGILTGSAVSAVAGLALLWLCLPRPAHNTDGPDPAANSV
jgi:NhaA family Na+:H+ antiporter